MRRDFFKEGNHSWDIVHEYHRCEECGKIFETRDKYEYHNGVYEKDLDCPFCKHKVTVKQKRHTILGPLFGR